MSVVQLHVHGVQQISSLTNRSFGGNYGKLWKPWILNDVANQYIAINSFMLAELNLVDLSIWRKPDIDVCCLPFH